MENEINDSKKEIRDRLLKIYQTGDKNEINLIVEKGSNVTDVLADIALEFDPDDPNQVKSHLVTDDRHKAAGIALYLIGEIGYLDKEWVQKIFDRFIKNRFNEDVDEDKVQCRGVFMDAINALKKCGYKVTE